MKSLTIGAAAVVAVLVLAKAAFGQAPVDGLRLGRDAALVQAQSCVGETGWDDVDSCVAMTWVHMRRAAKSGLRHVSMVRLYSAAIRRPTRRLWIIHLRRDGRRPERWPSNASWAAHRDRWLRLLAEVEATLRGERLEPCPGALHYGSTRLDPVPRTDRWERSTCLPESGQSFYRRRNP